jgi:hypothetical protein
MPKEDMSREKSLFHLIVVIARQLNANNQTYNNNISKSLRTLSIVKTKENYEVSLEVDSEPSKMITF